MAEEIQTYYEEKQLQALETNKGVKSPKRKQCLGRNNIATLREKDGTPIRDFDRMIRRCDAFYTKLYSTRHTGQPTANVYTRTRHK